jgi:hypothetical protein
MYLPTNSLVNGSSSVFLVRDRDGGSVSAWNTGNQTMSQRNTVFHWWHSKHADWSQAVLISRSEQRLLARSYTLGRQGEKGILDRSRDMSVYSYALGPCNAPTTFERLRETVLRGLTYNSWLVYLGDVIVIGRTFHDHLLNWRKVLEHFREACLKANQEMSPIAEGSTVHRAYCAT